MKVCNKKLVRTFAIAAAVVYGAPVLAANATLTIHGQEFTASGTPREFNGTIQYDTATVFFDPWGSGSYYASDVDNWGLFPVPGTLEFTLGAQAFSGELTSISIWKNTVSGQLYENFMSFNAGGYNFEMKFSRDTPIAWNREPAPAIGGMGVPGVTGLLPTAADTAFWHQPDVFAGFFTPNSWIIVDSYTFTGPSEVPVPAAAWLFGTGLAGLAAVSRSRARTAKTT